MIASMMYKIKIYNTHQTKRIHQRTRILPLWYQPTRILQHWNVEILKKMVACGLFNMKSAH